MFEKFNGGLAFYCLTCKRFFYPTITKQCYVGWSWNGDDKKFDTHFTESVDCEEGHFNWIFDATQEYKDYIEKEDVKYM